MQCCGGCRDVARLGTLESPASGHELCPRLGQLSRSSPAFCGALTSNSGDQRTPKINHVRTRSIPIHFRHEFVFQVWHHLLFPNVILSLHSVCRPRLYEPLCKPVGRNLARTIPIFIRQRRCAIPSRQQAENTLNLHRGGGG